MIQHTAPEVLKKVEAYIEQLEAGRTLPSLHVIGYELSVKAWRKDDLTLTRLRAMRSFLRQAIAMGFDGYACFDIDPCGATSGMWAHDTDCEFVSSDYPFVFRTFRSRDNDWMYFDGKRTTCCHTLRELRKVVAEDHAARKDDD